MSVQDEISEIENRLKFNETTNVVTVIGCIIIFGQLVLFFRPNPKTGFLSLSKDQIWLIVTMFVVFVVIVIFREINFQRQKEDILSLSIKGVPNRFVSDELNSLKHRMNHLEGLKIECTTKIEAVENAFKKGTIDETKRVEKQRVFQEELSSIDSKICATTTKLRKNGFWIYALENNGNLVKGGRKFVSSLLSDLKEASNLKSQGILTEAERLEKEEKIIDEVTQKFIKAGYVID
ncbi:hypothetical protein OAW23_10660 [Flavobacteriales bacterium]|nr:hypothetical protein [Flavobacteriales bacterium]